MGAAERSDLTSEVTHLLVGAFDSPKYKFVARERNDVTVLKPEWIEAVRQSWMQGEDTDVRVLEEEYKLPAFFGLTICITGFSDSEVAHGHSGDFGHTDTCLQWPFEPRYTTTPQRTGRSFARI